MSDLRAITLEMGIPWPMVIGEIEAIGNKSGKLTFLEVCRQLHARIESGQWRGDKLSFPGSNPLEGALAIVLWSDKFRKLTGMVISAGKMEFERQIVDIVIWLRQPTAHEESVLQEKLRYSNGKVIYAYINR